MLVWLALLASPVLPASAPPAATSHSRSAPEVAEPPSRHAPHSDTRPSVGARLTPEAVPPWRYIFVGMAMVVAALCVWIAVSAHRRRRRARALDDP